MGYVVFRTKIMCHAHGVPMYLVAANSQWPHRRSVHPDVPSQPKYGHRGLPVLEAGVVAESSGRQALPHLCTVRGGPRQVP
jgi:hypothetical protein